MMLGAALACAEVGAGVVDELVLAVGAAAAERVALDVLVEELGEVQLRRCSRGGTRARSAPRGRPPSVRAVLERWTGWPSRIRMIFCPLAWRMSLVRNSMNTVAMNFSLNAHELDRCPLLEIAEMTLAPNRWPCPRSIGVRPDRSSRTVRRYGRSASPVSSPTRSSVSARRALLDRGVALIQPAGDHLGVLLKRTPGGLLRAESPGRADAGPRSSRDRIPKRSSIRSQTKPASTETPAGAAGRDSAPDRLRDLRLLPRQKRRLLAGPPAPPARRERLVPTAAIGGSPTRSPTGAKRPAAARPRSENGPPPQARRHAAATPPAPPAPTASHPEPSHTKTYQPRRTFTGPE